MRTHPQSDNQDIQCVNYGWMTSTTVNHYMNYVTRYVVHEK